MKSTVAIRPEKSIKYIGIISSCLGQEIFAGEVVHPQKWIPEKHDKMIVNKKVAIIGSGATAVTAFPAIAKVAKHVTLVQRTPSYILSLPLEDNLGKIINHRLPDRILHFINR